MHIYYYGTLVGVYNLKQYRPTASVGKTAENRDNYEPHKKQKPKMKLKIRYYQES